MKKIVLSSPKTFTTVFLLVCIGVTSFLLFMINIRNRNLANQAINLPQSDATGLPPAVKAPNWKSGDPTPSPVVLTPVDKKNLGLLENPYPVELRGQITILPKLRGTKEDIYYAYIVAEDGPYKGQEFVLGLAGLQVVNPDHYALAKRSLGKRVLIKGKVHQEFVTWQLPNVVQRVVNVEEVQVL